MDAVNASMRHCVRRRLRLKKTCHFERSEKPLTIFFFKHAPEEENSQRYFAALNMTSLFQIEPRPCVPSWRWETAPRRRVFCLPKGSALEGWAA